MSLKAVKVEAQQPSLFDLYDRCTQLVAEGKAIVGTAADLAAGQVDSGHSFDPEALFGTLFSAGKRLSEAEEVLSQLYHQVRHD